MKFFINNSLKVVVVVVSILFLNSKSFSQIKVKVCSPGSLNTKWTERHLRKIITEGAHCDDGNEFWIIRSMADGIQTYNDPDKRAPKETLNYLQRVVVQDMKGAMLKIYDYSPDGVKQLNTNSIFRGWVSIYDVLPSNFPKSKKDGKIILTEKAMPTYIIRDNSNQKKIEEIEFYTSFDGKKTTGNRVVSQIPYYVFAKRGSRYLLSHKATVSIREGDIIESEMGGWIESEYVQIIKNRVCWEPCWEQSAFDFYKDKDFYVYNENKKDNAVSFRSRGINNKAHVISTKYKVQNGRKNLKGKRALQIKPERSGIVKVLVRGNADGEYTSDYIEEIGKSFENLKESLRKLNILFIIDGTESMATYFDNVASGIEQSMQKIGNLNSSVINEINFGVGIYRDKQNQNTKSFEYHPFVSSNKISQITNFLNNEVKFDDKGDTDFSESVYDGMEKSMRELFKNKENQKNVVILIGDAGDHQTLESEKSYHKKLENKILKLSDIYDVSWTIVQVSRKKTKKLKEYNHFVSNARKIIALSAKKINESSNSNHRLLPPEEDNYYGEYYNTNLDLDYKEDDLDNLEDYLMFGNIMYPKDGDVMKEKDLTEYITNSILNMHNSAKSMVRYTEGDFNSIPFRKILKSKGRTDTEIDLLNKMGFRIPGHLPINTSDGNNLNEHAMCKVIMMTEDELIEQQKLLKELASASQSSKMRANLIKVLTDKMIQVTGNSKRTGDPDPEVIAQIQDYYLNDIWRTLFGKDFTFDDEKGAKYSISDMNYSEKFDDEWMRDFSELLGDKYDLIKGESVSNCKFKEKTGITSNNGSDYLLYYPYDEFFP